MTLQTKTCGSLPRLKLVASTKEQFPSTWPAKARLQSTWKPVIPSCASAAQEHTAAAISPASPSAPRPGFAAIIPSATRTTRTTCHGRRCFRGSPAADASGAEDRRAPAV